MPISSPCWFATANRLALLAKLCYLFFASLVAGISMTKDGPARTIVSQSSRVLFYLFQNQCMQRFLGSYKYFDENFGNMLVGMSVDYDRVRSRLDSNPVIPPLGSEDSLSLVHGDEWRRLQEVRERKSAFFEKFEARELSEFVSVQLDELRVATRAARYAEHISANVFELVDCLTKEWFPFFVTLTVSDDQYVNVFDSGSRVWNNYIRRVRRAVGVRLGIPKAVADRRNIHRYFAVVERGGRNGRLHIHCLHLCKASPIALIDPNCGLRVPDKFEMTEWSKFWGYGFVSARPVRFNSYDIFTKCGFRWPVEFDEKTNCYKPYEAKGVVAVARYIGKYLLKSENEKDDLLWARERYVMQKKLIEISPKTVWRVKKSRGYGEMQLRMLIQSLPVKFLWMIMRGLLPRLVMHWQPVSKVLLRKLAAQEISRRLPKSFARMYCELDRDIGLVRKVETGTLLVPNYKDLGDFSWLQEMLPCHPMASVTSGYV